MDEPTIGIDPIQVVETRELISNLGEEHTMLLSSHILPEVSAICKRVLVINDGRIVADDKPDDLSEKLQHAERIEISVRGAEAPSFINAMRDISDVVDARSDQRVSVLQRAEREDFLPFIVDARPNVQASEKIAKTIVENGWGLTNLTPLPMTLEEIFLELTTEENLGE
jgi:ABC-2 type transport system ATP-binding protein